jgi:hypothetical protein
LVTAVPASTIDATHPGDADTCPQRQFRCRAFDDFTDDLMPGNEARPERRQIALDDVQVGAADSAGDDA